MDDNFHYMDDSERYCAGEFGSPDHAIAKCIEIVESSLEESVKTVKGAEELYKSYVMFGEDPFIVGPTDIKFSAWDYAKKRSEEIYPIEQNISNEEKNND